MLVVGVERVLHGATAPGDVVTVAYLLTIVSFPIRAIGWLLGEFPRSVVGYHRVRSVLRATGEMPYGEHRVDPDVTAGARLEVDGLGYRYDPEQPLIEGVSFTVEPGRTVALVGATASGKSTLTTLMARLVDPDEGRLAHRRHRPARLRAGRAGRRSSPWCRSRRSSSTTPSGATSRSACRRLRRRRLGGAAGRPGRRVRRGPARRARQPARRARHVALRWSAAADLAGPRAGPQPAAAGPRRRHLGGRPRGRGAHPRGAAATRDAAAAWSWSPTARPRSGWPTRSSTSRTAGSPTAAPHAELLGRSPAYARLVNAYEQTRRAGRGGDAHEPPHRWTPARTSARSRPCAAASRVSPELTDGLRGTIAAGVPGRDRPGRGADRGAADPRPRDQRPRRTRRLVHGARWRSRRPRRSCSRAGRRT